MIDNRTELSRRGQSSGRGSHGNIGETERWISAIGGSVLLAAGLTRRGGTLLSVAGGYLIYRGLRGNCALYRALGVSTVDDEYAVSRDRGILVEEEVVIDATPEELYAFWRDFENLPRFMTHLEEVRTLPGNRSHWRARGPAGTDVEWDAEVVGDIENEMISWRSIEGAMVPNAGSVRFKRVAAGTRVQVALKYNPPGGAIGGAIARLFGEEPGIQIHEDLQNLKETIERGEVTLEGRRDTARSAVTEASMESFPASDPPAYNTGRGRDRD